MSTAIGWDEVNRIFAPFRGSCLYGIRADVFFHLSLAAHNPWRYRAKNLLYPLRLVGRGARAQKPRRGPGRSQPRYLFVCDYAAEPGFGTLRPLLETAEEDVLFLGTDAVMRARGSELVSCPRVCAINGDREAPRLANSSWSALWKQVQADWTTLCANTPARWQPAFRASRVVLSFLLLRAHLYGRLLQELFRSFPSLAVVVTHNDFMSLSYLACSAAQRTARADVTLQHGFPSQEYFPVFASRYLLWGEVFCRWMKNQGTEPGRLQVVGAPRLDAMARRYTQPHATNNKLAALGIARAGKCNLVFLSQSHAATLTPAQHAAVLDSLQCVANDGRFHVIVRFHPQETRRLYQARPELLARACFPPKNLGLAELLLGADVVVSSTSTAMLEAMLATRPVIQILPRGMELASDAFEAALRVQDGAELVEQALRLMSAPGERRRILDKQTQLLGRYVHEPGRGTENAWHCIAAACQGRSRP